MRPSAELRRSAELFARTLRSDPRTGIGAFSVNPKAANWTLAVDAAGRDGFGGFAIPSATAETGYMFHNRWPTGYTMDDPGVSSGLQEASTIAVALEQVVPGNCHSHVWTDSSVVVDGLARGRSSSVPLNRVIAHILETCTHRNITLTVAWHARSSSNSAIAADMLSRGMFQQAGLLVPQISRWSRKALSCNATPVFGTLPSSTEMRLRQQPTAGCYNSA